MGLLTFFQDNLGAIAGAAGVGVAGVLGWVAANAIGRPLLTFRSDRMEVLRAVQKRQNHDMQASTKQQQEVESDLHNAQVTLQAYATGASFAIRWYCRLMRYDLDGAATSLRGLMHPVLLYGIADVPKLRAHGVRACLGATRGMAPARVTEARKAAQDLVKALPAHYQIDVGQVQSPAMQAFSAAFSRIQTMWDSRGWLADVFVKSVLAKKLKTIPLEHINMTPKANVIVPALSAVPLTQGEPVLQELWANLIASEMDKRVAQGVLPSFVEIVNALTSDEAKLLKTINAGVPVPIVRIQQEVFDDKGERISGLDVEKNLSRIGFKAGCEYPRQVPAYLDNLARLRLIEFQAPGTSYADTSLYGEVESDPEIEALRLRYEQPPTYRTKYVRTGLELTEFGRGFINACVKP